jgi:protease I
MAALQGRTVAILATNGYERSELVDPRRALDEAGARTVIVSPTEGSIRSWDNKDWGDSVPVDEPLQGADPARFDALLIPGGVMNPDTLRTDANAVRFVKHFFEQGKPVGSICHGPWLLVEAGVVRGRHLTSWPSLRTDILNAGGEWSDREVVTDEGLVTSRKPADLPAFCAKLIEEIAEGRHEAGAHLRATRGDRPSQAEGERRPEL